MHHYPEWRRTRITLLIPAVMLMTAGFPAVAGEVLYNGIELPTPWPPRAEKLTPEPQVCPYLSSPPAVIPIDIGRQLFVDDFLIEQTNLQRVFHTAEYVPENPVLRPDRPWEQIDGIPHAMPFSNGVWYDPRDRLFKMWYMAGYLKSVAYAVSRDGRHWEKPELDIVPGTNIVLELPYCDSSTVWLDHTEKDPERRFKMAIFEDKKEGRLRLRFSPDGIHWSAVVKTTGDTGDRSTFFHNPFRGVWVFSIRQLIAVGDTERARMRYYHEGGDFLSAAGWAPEEPIIWVGADRLDPRRPDLDVQRQLYNLDGTPYESLMLGLFSIWQGPENKVCRAEGIQKRNEILLGFSRDGFHWHRPDRRPFIAVDDTPGSWRNGNIQSAGGGCLIVGERLYFYFSARAHCPSNRDACGSTGLATLRRDGFASLDAGNSRGTITTRRVCFSGKYLFVNADLDGGQLRAEVLDEKGLPIAPFTWQNCLPATRDATCQSIQWRGASDLSTLVGRAVRFRFFVERGSLYAFWVSPDPSGASRGYVAAGGPDFTGPTDTAGPLTDP